MRRHGWFVLEGIVIASSALVTGCAAETPAVAQQTKAAPPMQGVPQVAPDKTLDRAVESLAQQIATSLPAEKKPLTAVLDFNDLSGCVSSFGRLVGEELITKLFQTKRVRVVERSLLEKAVNELKFNLSELVDQTRAKQLGKQVGADAIVTGTITDLGGSVKVNARLIEVEQGDILAAAGAEVAKDGVVARLVSQPLSCPGKGPIPPPPVAHKTEVKNYAFEIQECKKKGGGITCALLVTNLGDDSDLTIFGTGSFPQSRLFDTRGHVYEARVRVGNSHEENNVTFKLVKGIPTALTLNFEQISADVSGIALIEVGCIERGGSRITAQFRNVPLAQ